MNNYSTNRQGLHPSDSASDDLSDLDFGIDECDQPVCSQDEIEAMLAGLGETTPIPVFPSVGSSAPIADAIVPLRMALAGWFTRHEAFKRKQAAFRASLKPEVKLETNILNLVHPTNYVRMFGVSHRTVARRQKAGMASGELLKPVQGLLLDERRYSATEFAKAFKISKRVVLAGMKAGRSAAEILETRRPRGRPASSK